MVHESKIQMRLQVQDERREKHRTCLLDVRAPTESSYLLLLANALAEIRTRRQITSKQELYCQLNMTLSVSVALA